MLLWRRWGAAASVIAAFALAESAGADTGTDGQRGSCGGESAGSFPARIDVTGLGAPPRFQPSPAMLQEQPSRETQELILVPLPAPVWVTATGLSGLAIVAAWRRHKLREQ
jgi:hypothetical protein